MRDAATVLSIIRERGKRGLPLEDIYRQLYNPELYLYAYARLYSNDGAMTRGITHETVDAMSLKKIETIIDAVRHERYRWTPVKRIYIPKKNGKMRPLGIPSWSDKLLQEVIRLILEAYYEPQFSDHSHGFRPERGCHTALTKVKETWTGTKWFLEGDITQCYDRIDHQALLNILREKLHDNRFLRLINHLLQAGYLEDWRYHKTLSGTPQGSIVSPILSNIYLDKMDKYIETVLIPQYTRGEQRKQNSPYFSLMKKASKKRKKGELKEAHKLTKQAQKLPTIDPNDPNYRRLYYIRYADDTLFGFAVMYHQKSLLLTIHCNPAQTDLNLSSNAVFSPSSRWGWFWVVGVGLEGERPRSPRLCLDCPCTPTPTAVDQSVEMCLCLIKTPCFLRPGIENW